MRRVSGPLLDRIDLRVVMPRIGAGELVGTDQPEESAAVAARIVRAWHRSQARNDGRANALLRGRQLLGACAMEREARDVLLEVARGLGLTARGVHRVLRVARTVADLRERERVGRHEILAAASLRDQTMDAGLAA
jgi:magnesium chelatase family protein